MPFPIRFSWEKLSVYCWRDPTLNNFTRSIACPLGANEAKIGSGILLSEEWSEKGGRGGACGKTPESNPLLMSILWSCFSGSSFLLLQSFKCLTSEETATLSLPLSLTVPNCGLENASSVNHNRPWDHGYKAKLKQLKKYIYMAEEEFCLFLLDGQASGMNHHYESWHMHILGVSSLFLHPMAFFCNNVIGKGMWVEKVAQLLTILQQQSKWHCLISYDGFPSEHVETGLMMVQ